MNPYSYSMLPESFLAIRTMLMLLGIVLIGLLAISRFFSNIDPQDQRRENITLWHRLAAAVQTMVYHLHIIPALMFSPSIIGTILNITHPESAMLVPTAYAITAIAVTGYFVYYTYAEMNKTYALVVMFQR